ncbi:heme-copper oxidase subunit III [Roseivirga sp. BDSF3-8]|uniref:cytochrome c oxidase subunit 3 n=1 Tax=Roseivirga sp. BDSF3-8 TaxID=3241598 RepID=UPI003531CC2A
MESRKDLRKSSINPSTFDRIERMHPHKMLVWLALIGSTLIFSFLLVAFAYTRYSRGQGLVFDFPKAFVVSTFMLLLSSFTIKGVVQAFRQDRLHEVTRQLGVTLMLGMSFIASQAIGWQQLLAQNLDVSKAVGASYLYALSGLHVLHLLVALSFLAVLFVQFYRAHRDPVKALILHTNPYQGIKLEIATILWHFMDVLWFVLFFYFLFTF